MLAEFGLGVIDYVVFFAFIAAVLATGMLKSRRGKDEEAQSGEDYFLAGRGLKWWLIGFSLIAANISTEQFVGMSGNAASHIGLAVASYEWMAAITLVVVAFCFLPYFLKAGIFTMPEFLEYRYNGAARFIMAMATLLIYVLLLGSVTYSGALTIKIMAGKAGMDIGLFSASLVIGLIAMIYVVTGGLKACAWADLIQGAALIVGGAIIMFFVFDKLGTATEASYVGDTSTGQVVTKTLEEGTGSIERFWDLNKVRMNMFLDKSDSVLPWTALLLGLWIPNFYYWGLNQYITQRTLGSASLAEGQKGIVFSAFMKLIIPFVIVVPGIVAFNLFAGDMKWASADDNAKVVAKYEKLNSDTELVDIQTSPSKESMEAWADGKFMIAIFDDSESLKSSMKDVTTKSAYVLPITKEDYDAASASEYTVFKSDDKSFPSSMPNFYKEMTAYSETVQAKAEAAGASVSTEKLIAYKYDTALAQLLTEVLPANSGLVGFVLAALLGAVVSSLAAMLNAASTIFTMDFFVKHIDPEAKQKTIVRVGRGCVIVFTLVSIGLAPALGNPKVGNSIFSIIQEGQGFISSGILSIFVIGLLVRKAPRICGVVGLLTNIVSYGVLKVIIPDVSFLNRMAICFGICMALMLVITAVMPLKEPIVFKENTEIQLTTSNGAKVVGVVVVILTLALYVLFSPIGLCK